MKEDAGPAVEPGMPAEKAQQEVSVSDTVSQLRSGRQTALVRAMGDTER